MPNKIVTASNHPVGGNITKYGSDRIVTALKELGIEYLALNPGATIRGLHDSIVNGGDGALTLILTMHEEIAVALAHGYAKASGRPMAVGLHDTVGMLHATMALFNAWVDRAPVIALVGTGPLDASKRRPWIDWIHTPGDQGEVVRHFTKWNDQPASVGSTIQSIRRGWRAAMAQPQGPSVIGIDVLLQEQEVDGSEGGSLAAVARSIGRIAPDPDLVEAALKLLHSSSRPLIITERPLSISASASLVKLAERAGAALLDLGVGGTFPVGHPHDVTDDSKRALAASDLLIFIDVADPGRALGSIDLASRQMSGEGTGVNAIAIGLTEATDRAWLVTESDVPARLTIVADPGLALDALCDGWGERRRPLDDALDRLAHFNEPSPISASTSLDRASLVGAVARAARAEDVVLANAGVLRGSDARRAFRFQRADQYLGSSGGEGLGYGAPASIGAALAHRGSGRLVVDLQGDGDLMFVPQSLWTAAHHKIPLLMVVDANRSYMQDRHHQTVMAEQRQHPLTGVGVGIDMEGPRVQFAALARSLGVHAEGPISEPRELDEALKRAVQIVRAGEPVVVEVDTIGE